MMIINNNKDWRYLLNTHWMEVCDIIAHTIDLKDIAFMIPGDSKSPMTGRTIGDELEYLRKTKDGETLCRYLNAAWALSSETYAHSVPGWNEFCSLCSEEWALSEIEI